MEREEITRAAADFIVYKVESSLEDVAEGIGVTPEELRTHFPDEIALRAAVARLGTDRIEESLDAARVDEGSAEDAVRRIVDECWPHAPLRAFLYGENRLVGTPELDAALERIDARGNELFERGREDGSFRTDLPAAWMGAALWSLLAVASWNVRNDHLPAEDGPRSIKEMLLDGARRVPAPQS
ncbi:TetR/AcrR family transcriptional regulator [Streptomonospora nanhaiensis]|uniref:AcrR family transcriptional regulator n=1 Tax=Streptomonospora nanhaiensis TaxID=1323731 RepID=A0A853BY10_9ACTN|nr:TetR/AcrR family transcriptional regulator [Streptomonospora nanhaiensis]MBX9390059.1 TetR/AcrR family transcriptional regulator [Streptomonospora nanhaiensis]NYI99052.1 AcrR family transcriptional regulator [Streptomonospora nanhaiensis]